MKLLIVLTTTFLLAACGGDGVSDEAIWFEDGYNEGQYDVCAELASISPSMMQQLRNCQGFDI